MHIFQLLNVLHSSQLACMKCVLKLNRAVDTLRTKSEVVISLCCYRYSAHITWQHYMTFITKVGLSFFDHMNDDTTVEVRQLISPTS